MKLVSQVIEMMIVIWEKWFRVDVVTLWLGLDSEWKRKNWLQVCPPWITLYNLSLFSFSNVCTICLQTIRKQYIWHFMFPQLYVFLEFYLDLCSTSGHSTLVQQNTHRALFTFWLKKVVLTKGRHPLKKVANFRTLPKLAKWATNIQILWFFNKNVPI